VGIGRPGPPAKIEAEIVAGRAARVAMTAVPTEVLVAAAQKVAMKAGPAAGVDARLMDLPKSNSRS